MGSRTLLRLASILGLAGASACATAVVDPGPGAAAGDAQAPKSDAAPTKDAATKAVPEAGAGPTFDDAGTTVVDDSTCAADSTRAQCEQCCLGVHPSGYAVYHQTLLACACQAPAACATECATELCVQKPTSTGDACEQCISASLAQAGACYGAVANSCQSDVDCTALFQGCIPPCETK